MLVKGKQQWEFASQRNLNLGKKLEKVLLVLSIKVLLPSLFNKINLVLILGKNVFTGEEVAVKIEDAFARHPQLAIEDKFYRVMAGGSKSHDTVL